MPGEIFVGYRVESNDVEADAFVVARKNEVEHFVVYTGVLLKYSRLPQY